MSGPHHSAETWEAKYLCCSSIQVWEPAAERVLLPLCHPRVSLANRNRHPPVRTLSAECTCGKPGTEWFWGCLQDACWHWLKFGSDFQEALCSGIWGKTLVVSGKLPLRMSGSNPLQCCNRCQCWGLLVWWAWVAQGPLFHSFCADTAEAEHLGIHLPLANVSYRQCSNRNRNSGWSKLIHKLAKAAGCQVSYAGFCRITMPGLWCIRNTVCSSWNLAELIVLLHIPKLYKHACISSLSLVYAGSWVDDLTSPR